jgi:ArsR family transcriptional regulator, lead/cadmium/zinc/bismuth-responsive transcriptional repressor
VFLQQTKHTNYMNSDGSKTCIRVYADVKQIKACKSRLETISTPLQGLARLLNLAGNEVRLKILFLLKEQDELCPCDLSDILGMTVPAVSQHLSKLKAGNLVKQKKVAQTVFYSLTLEAATLLQPHFESMLVTDKISY